MSPVEATDRCVPILFLFSIRERIILGEEKEKRKEMTKTEAAIVTAYTGVLIGDFDDFHKYAESLMGQPVFTHEIPRLTDELKYRSRNDFMNIKVE